MSSDSQYATPGSLSEVLQEVGNCDASIALEMAIRYETLNCKEHLLESQHTHHILLQGSPTHCTFYGLEYHGDQGSWCSVEEGHQSNWSVGQSYRGIITNHSE